LCLYFTCTKLRHILLSAETIVICKSDVIKHILSAPVLKGRLGKWMFALSEFDTDTSLQKQSNDKHWRILLRTGSALILLHYLFVLGLCSLTDRLVMMGAVWEFCWSRLVGRHILFPSE